MWSEIRQALLSVTLDERQVTPMVQGGGTGAGLAALASALIGSAPPEVTAMLDRATDAQMAGEAWITQLGAMLSRPHQPIRLNIGGRSRAAIQDYAERVGTSPESLERLETWFDLATGLDADFIVAIDLAESVLPRIGLEFYFADTAGSGQFLERLGAQGLCNAAERDGIRLWNEGSRLARRLNHVKLVASSSDDVSAKAYLAAHYQGDAAGWERPA